MSKKHKNLRIELYQFNGFLNKMISDLENNSYYNQTWVWCEKCGQRHRMDSKIALRHKIKPIPLNCLDFNDHCWKYTSKKKYGYLDVIIGRKDNQYINFLLEVCAVSECIVCKKEKLGKGYLIESIETLEDQFNKDVILFSNRTELNDLIKFIKHLKENSSELMMRYELKFEDTEKTYLIHDINKKLYEIQHLEHMIFE